MSLNLLNLLNKSLPQLCFVLCAFEVNQSINHNNNGDFSIDNDVVFINENQNDFTWSGISIINPKILIPHLGKSYPFDLWKDILIPLVDDKKITAHHDDEFWVDVGNSDRLALARKHFKEEN